MKLKALLNKSWPPLRKGAMVVASQSPFWLKAAVMALAMTGGSLVTANLTVSPTSALTPSISLSISNPTTSCPDNAGYNKDADICLNMPRSGGIVTGSHNIRVTTMSGVLGYGLTLSSTSDDANMLRLISNGNYDAGGTKIAPVGVDKKLADKQWGYTLDTDAEANKAGAIWLPLQPAGSGDVLANKTSASATDGDTITVSYGANVADANSLTAGDYQAKVQYTATANMPEPPIADLVSGGACLNHLCEDGRSFSPKVLVSGTNMSLAKYIYLDSNKNGKLDDDDYRCTANEATSTSVQCYTTAHGSDTFPFGPGKYDVYVSDVAGNISKANQSAVVSAEFNGENDSYCYGMDGDIQDCYVAFDKSLTTMCEIGLGVLGLVDCDSGNYNYYYKQWADAIKVDDSFDRYSIYYIYSLDAGGGFKDTRMSDLPEPDKYEVGSIPLGVGFALPDSEVVAGGASGVSGLRLTPVAALRLMAYLIVNYTNGDVEGCPPLDENDSSTQLAGVTCVSEKYMDVDTARQLGFINPVDKSQFNFAKTMLQSWLYVPRFAYQITSVSANDGISSEANFNIFFHLKGYKYIGTKVGEWRTHPAFTRCDDSGNCTELDGFWVSVSPISGTLDKLTATPSDKPITNLAVGQQYTVAKSLGLADTANTGGSTVDGLKQNALGLANSTTHMITNDEYGAMVYLLKSDHSDVNSYSATSMPLHERVAGGYSTNGSMSGVNVGSPIKKPYASIYNFDDIHKCTLLNCGGGALYETLGWGGGKTNFVSASKPWLVRGGTSVTDANMFGFDADDGSANPNIGFRAVMITEPTSSQ